MNSIPSIALSGLQAAHAGIGTSAHNIANALTPDFRRQRVAQQALPEGGVATQIERSPVTGDALAEDIVAMKLNAHLYTANLKVLRTHDQMLGTLLDATA